MKFDNLKELNFVVEDSTLDLIEKLQVQFNAPTNADLFRKLLALGSVIAEHSKDSDAIVIRGSNEPITSETTILLKK